MGSALRLVLKYKIDHQFNHENLDDFIGYSIPVTESLLIYAVLAMLLLKMFGELL